MNNARRADHDGPPFVTGFSRNWYVSRKSYCGWVDRREWWPPYYGGLTWPRVYVRGAGPQRAWIVLVSLWIPFSLAALPTAWLWWRDRRRVQPGALPLRL